MAATAYNSTRTFKSCGERLWQLLQEHNVFRHRQSTNWTSLRHFSLPNSHWWYACLLPWGPASAMSLLRILVTLYCGAEAVWLQSRHTSITAVLKPLLVSFNLPNRCLGCSSHNWYSDAKRVLKGNPYLFPISDVTSLESCPSSLNFFCISWAEM